MTNKMTVMMQRTFAIRSTGLLRRCHSYFHVAFMHEALLLVVTDGKGM